VILVSITIGFLCKKAMIIWLSMDDKSAEINPVFWQRAG
jgi:hypothetical protein